ncbi:MAG TPA: hypothetical protein VN420_02820 [Candidatus Fimivivens sp.]|nr:hypothetical protein [Candidatus Fimivivens sp.]
METDITKSVRSLLEAAREYYVRQVERSESGYMSQTTGAYVRNCTIALEDLRSGKYWAVAEMLERLRNAPADYFPRIIRTSQILDDPEWAIQSTPAETGWMKSLKWFLEWQEIRYRSWVAHRAVGYCNV